jgi:hypothetical protein
VNSTSPTRWRHFDTLVLAAVLLICLVHAPLPRQADQSLFALIAKNWHEGGVLYRDIWDMKHPGIFLYYRLAGALFDFDEAGIHLFDALYMLAFALTVLFAAGAFYRRRWVVRLAALLAIGCLYGPELFKSQTQVETLVGFPLFVAVWGATKSAEPESRGWWWMALSGFAAALVFLFKFPYFALPACFWVVAFFERIRGLEEKPAVAFRRVAAPATAGFLIPTALTLVYFAAAGTLRELHHAFFTVYAEMGEDIFAFLNFENLTAICRSILPWMVPLLGLGVFAWIDSPRTRIAALWRRCFLLWIVVGVFLILIQVFSWHSYHMQLIVVPAVLLGIKGFEVLWEHLVTSGEASTRRVRAWIAGFAFVMIVCPYWISWATTAAYLVKDRFAIREEDRRVFQSRNMGASYSLRWDEIDFIRSPERQPGPIHVFWDPWYVFHSGRSHTIPFFSINLYLYSQTGIHHVERMIEHHEAAYIFVQPESRYNLSQIHPHILEMLEKRYRRVRESRLGVWYERPQTNQP